MLRLLAVSLLSSAIALVIVFGIVCALMDGGQICLTPMGIVADWM